MKHASDIVAHEAAAAPAPRGAPRPWWEGRYFVAAMILLAFVPLLWPAIPPVVDLGGHMGRYKVAMDLANSATLQQWYDFHWVPVGNLGVDLLVVPLGKLIGLEPATKLIVMSIPPLTVAGLLWVAREVHNRLPPTVAFALPLAFGHPFMFGFVNYALSMALALLAFGLWLRLGRLGKPRLRAALFVPISFIIYFAHAFGWGTLGLLCYSAEVVRQHDRGNRWWRAVFTAIPHALPLAGPVLMILLWRSDANGGFTRHFFDWQFKWEYLLKIFRDRWEMFDKASAAVLAGVLALAIFHPRLTLSRNLLFSALVLTAVYFLLPRMIFGSAYADMRITPYIVMLYVLAIRFRFDTDLHFARILAVLAVAFLLIRLGSNTASFAMAWDKQRDQLRAIDHIEKGSRVAILIWGRCELWEQRRSDHIGSLALVRKEAYVNDQWPMVGSSLLTVHYPQAGWFQHDPSQITRNRGCRHEGWRVDYALQSIPVQAFDYLWLIDMRPIPEELLRGWTPVFVTQNSWLFRRTDAATPPPATPQTASVRAQ
nr:hypothetical protein [uncultured Sphingomonas sp.]